MARQRKSVEADAFAGKGGECREKGVGGYRCIMLVFVTRRAHGESEHKLLRRADDFAEVFDFSAQSVRELHNR